MNQLTRNFQEVADLFSEGLVKQLEARGHNFIEATGDKAYLFDSQGNKYIDCYSSASVYNLGRRNEELVKELNNASKQIDQGVFIMISEQKAKLAAKMSAFVPGNLECSLMQVVRGESFDAACKLARGYTNRKELISVDGGWYGDTGFAISLSDRNDKAIWKDLIPETRTMRFNDIEEAKQKISKKTAAVVLETIQVENGCRVAEQKYMQELRSACTKMGALLIIDETQTGFGRCGKKFSFERYNEVQPDIIIIGESLCGGMFPVAGMVYTSKIKGFFDDHPMIHLNTFGGHDIGCRVACRALDLYETLKPWENAETKGITLLEGIKKNQQQYSSIIKNVSGVGLMIAMEFKNSDSAEQFCKWGAGNGLYVVPGEIQKSSVVLRPSLLITTGEADYLLKAVNKTLIVMSEKS